MLDSIGAGDLQPQLNQMSKQGRWQEMGELITEDIMDKFAVVGEPESLATQIKMRYGDIIDRTSAAYADLPREKKIELVAALKAS